MSGATVVEGRRPAGDGDESPVIRRCLDRLVLGSVGVEERVGLVREILDRRSPEVLAASSREQATHYKWALGQVGGGGGGRVWFHEFKPGLDRITSHARSVHNHRYDLDVWILDGGYANDRFAVALSDRDGRLLAECDRDGVEDVAPGAHYHLSADDYHQLRSIRPGTVTVVLESPPRRTFSVSIDLATSSVSTHHPIELRVPEIRSAVSQLCARPSLELP